MNSILTIFKKELARFFGDRRMVLSTILLPGLLIYVLYTFMGTAMTDMYGVEEDYQAKISVVNMPASVQGLLQGAGIGYEDITPEQEVQVQEEISNQQADLLMVFPEDFDQAVAAYDSSSGGTAPNVQVYYNSAGTNSQATYTMMVQLLDQYEAQMSNKFDLNSGDTVYDLATEQDTVGSIFSSLLPMLLMIFLFSGCMSVAPESISGEKERGTIATLLVTPMKRSHLAMGKIGALAIIALLSGLSSTLGTILSLPKLMGAASDSLDATVYSVTDYLMLGVVILSTVLVLVAMISLISAFAKTIKEAQTLVMPLMVVAMFVGITAMFGGGAQTDLYYYLIPLYNSVQCMVAIFSFEISTTNILVAVVSNLVYTGLGVFLLAKMFNSERIVFSK